MNIYSLYKRKCDSCDKNIVSIYHKDLPLKVYCSACWWNDSWDGTEYAKDYDSNKSFFEQLLELRNETPFMSLENQATTLVNTEYTNYSSNIKNSYLTYFADYAENCYYVSVMNTVKDSVDCYRIRESEMCYGSSGISKSYRTFFSQECDSCFDVYFSKNLTGCSNCFGCINLRKKSYCIFNKQYTKEEYESFLSALNLGSFKNTEKYEKEAHDFWITFPHKYYYGNALNSNVSGDYIYESKNTHDAYMVTGAEDSRFVQMLSVPKTKDSYDYTGWGDGAERVYECQSVGFEASNVKFSMHSYPGVMNADYSYYGMGSKNIFGCVNLKKKEYCILNKQYSKQEYEILKNKIIEEMKANPYVDSQGRVWGYGEFFPLMISPFGYNETIAMDYFPMSKEEALSAGFTWHESEKNQYDPTIKAADLPDSISDADDSVLKEVVECSNCSRAFKIVAEELSLLKKMNMPLPHHCPECRRIERFKKTNLPRLYDRNCAKCGNDIKTLYAPERPEIVYCESCYQQEIS